MAARRPRGGCLASAALMVECFRRTSTPAARRSLGPVTAAGVAIRSHHRARDGESCGVPALEAPGRLAALRSVRTRAGRVPSPASSGAPLPLSTVAELVGGLRRSLRPESCAIRSPARWRSRADPPSVRRRGGLDVDGDGHPVDPPPESRNDRRGEGSSDRDDRPRRGPVQRGPLDAVGAAVATGVGGVVSMPRGDPDCAASSIASRLSV